ncbi:hypothetical protein KAR91_34300 [Candidatus Pacearchaeota archaeon]|nr:hypothetical protein [Candidatus Pacearchaeota archaeon]
MKAQATHLGDGAYVSNDKRGNVQITANHHNPDKATDSVYVQREDVPKLIKFLEDTLKAGE